MAKKETSNPTVPVLPMLKTVEQMSRISGIGENKLRELMDSGELEYIQNGNRRLLAELCYNVAGGVMFNVSVLPGVFH